MAKFGTNDRGNDRANDRGNDRANHGVNYRANHRPSRVADLIDDQPVQCTPPQVPEAPRVF